jgi:hypothetical protein
LERQRLSGQEDGTSYPEEELDDGIDHTLSDFPRASSATSKTRKNKTQTIEWDTSMDQLKRDKEAAEAVWGSFLHSIILCIVSDISIQT